MRVNTSHRAKAVLTIALMLAACSAKPADGATPPVPAPTPAPTATPAPQVARHPESGLPVVPLTVRRGMQRLPFRVEVARTGAEQAKGLMFRTAMGENEGMIFPMNPPRLANFWMKNTVMSLDIIFIGINRRVLNIAANTTPYSEDAIPSAGQVSAVLELNAGRAAALGIRAGDRVDW